MQYVLILQKKSLGGLLNLLSANPTKWSNTLTHFVAEEFLSVFDNFVGLALKGLKIAVLEKDYCN